MHQRTQPKVVESRAESPAPRPRTEPFGRVHASPCCTCAVPSENAAIVQQQARWHTTILSIYSYYLVPEKALHQGLCVPVAAGGGSAHARTSARVFAIAFPQASAGTPAQSRRRVRSRSVASYRFIPCASAKHPPPTPQPVRSLHLPLVSSIPVPP